MRRQQTAHQIKHGFKAPHGVADHLQRQLRLDVSPRRSELEQVAQAKQRAAKVVRRDRHHLVHLMRAGDELQVLAMDEQLLNVVARAGVVDQPARGDGAARGHGAVERGDKLFPRGDRHPQHDQDVHRQGDREDPRQHPWRQNEEDRDGQDDHRISAGHAAVGSDDRDRQLGGQQREHDQDERQDFLQPLIFGGLEPVAGDDESNERGNTSDGEPSIQHHAISQIQKDFNSSIDEQGDGEDLDPAQVDEGHDV